MSFHGSLRCWYLWMLRGLAVLALLLLLVAAFAFNWAGQLRLYWQELNTSEEVRAANFWLPDYRLVQQVVLDGLTGGETSGLTWDRVRGRLFCVTGRTQLIELDREGHIMRRIALVGFSDPEGVESLGDGRLAIVDERRRVVAIFNLTPDTHSVAFEDTLRFDLGFAASGNKGFEGIGWDSWGRQLVLAKERDPVALFGLAMPANTAATGELEPLAVELDLVRDLSSVSVDPRTGNFLLLSDESRLLLEVDRLGQPVSFMSLLPGLHGLKDIIRQAEGVTLDDQGRLYIVAEPNQLYIFQRRGEAP